MRPIAPALLAWFDKNKRLLPFRQEPTPYHIWVSEIMLQQTRVTAALPYYERFIAALPDIPALAACPDDKLCKLWEGLGYYSRARNLQKAARVVCETYGGQLPADYEALKSLPGIGPYTAGAVASIGFGLAAPAVDGNVLRVFARLYNDARDIAGAEMKAACTARVMEHQPAGRPGAYNEALMELGALVCLPGGAPLCEQCPLAAQCMALAAGAQNELPFKAAKKPRRVQPVTVALVRSGRGWLVQRRPARGLLAGLWQPFCLEDALTERQLRDEVERLTGRAVPQGPLPEAKHIFTHIEWRLGGWRFSAPACALPEGFAWADAAQLAADYTLPNAFKAYRKIMLEDA